MPDETTINLKDINIPPKLRDVLEKISIVARDLSDIISVSPIRY